MYTAACDNLLFICTKDVLPIVEFTLEDGITHEEAVQLIQETPDEVTSVSVVKKDKWQEEVSEDYQTLKMNSDPDLDNDFDVDQELGQYYSPGGFAGHQQQGNTSDPFTLNISRRADERESASRIIVGRSLMKQMKSSEIFVALHPPPLRPSYYRNLVPDMSVSMCSVCFRFFMEDFEISASLDACCPFCRRTQEYINE